MDLKTYLEKRGVTQSDIARRINVPPALVWQWINGVRPISAKHAIPIEQATDGEVPRHVTRPDIYPPSEAA